MRNPKRHPVRSRRVASIGTSCFDYAQHEVVACAVYVLVHRVRQQAAKDNIVVVKADGILFIVFKSVVPLF